MHLGHYYISDVLLLDDSWAFGLSYIEELDYLSHLIYPEKRRPYTKNGQKCITDCKFPGDSIIHPYNNIKITEYNEPFCATDSWYEPNSKRLLQHDTCNYTHSDLIAWSEIDSSNFIPLISILANILINGFSKSS